MCVEKIIVVVVNFFERMFFVDEVGKVLSRQGLAADDGRVWRRGAAQWSLGLVIGLLKTIFW